MENLDDIIGKTLGSLDNIQAVEVPNGFADGVLARLPQKKKQTSNSGFMLSMVAAIALLVAVNAWTWVKTGNRGSGSATENVRTEFAKTFGIIDEQGGVY